MILSDAGIRRALTSPVLDLAEQRFADTANNFLIQAELERDGSYILKP